MNTMARSRLLPGNFTIALLSTVAIASFLPCRGDAALAFNWITNFAVGLLFFLHGAKLPREAIIASATHWRLHLLVLFSTFAMFPLLGLALRPALAPLMTPDLYAGMLFLCALPSAVQSSIAFTSMAKGNVPAAVCSASASSLIGIVVTPLIVRIILSRQAGGESWHTVLNIMLQLLAPFVAGQLMRPWIGRWIAHRAAMLKLVDQGSILLFVYTAFSEAVNQGLWRQIPPSALLALLFSCAVLLAIALLITGCAARWLGFEKADRITIVFCGSKKSLAAGIPMAKVIFADHALGAIVLPLMLFHQIQLMVCAVLAQRWGACDTHHDARECATCAQKPLTRR